MTHSPWIRPERLPSRSAWCAHVTVAPDVSRMIVFRSGRWKGSNTSTPVGGQAPPVNVTRATCRASSAYRLASKNAQNQATKNITSEAMNRTIP